MPVEKLKILRQRHAPSGSFLSNILTLMSGTAVAQALPILLSPLLTRLYEPKDFGLFALYSSIAAVMAVVATGRYELAIMLPEKDEDAAAVGVLSLSVAGGVSLLSLVIMACFGSFLAGLLNNREIGSWLYLVPLTVVMTGFNQVLVYWCNRKKRYHLLAKGGALQSAAVAAISVSVGFLHAGAAGLILGSFTGLVAYGLFLARAELPRAAEMAKPVESGQIRRLAAAYRDMPLFSTMEAFIGMIALQLPLFFMTSYYSISTAGHYSLAYKIVMLPMALVGGAIGQVFYQRFTASLAANEDSTRLLRKTWLTLGSIALVPSLVFFFYAPQLFGFFFGASWLEAGKIATYLSVLMFTTFVFSTTSFSHVALRIQHISLLFAVASLLCKTAIIYFCYKLSASFYVMLTLVVAYETVQCLTMNVIAFVKTSRMRTSPGALA